MCTFAVLWWPGAITETSQYLSGLVLCNTSRLHVVNQVFDSGKPQLLLLWLFCWKEAGVTKLGHSKCFKWEHFKMAIWFETGCLYDLKKMHGHLAYLDDLEICLCTLCFRIHNHTVVHVQRTQCADFWSNICDFVCTHTNKTMEEVLLQLLEIKRTRCTCHILLVWWRYKVIWLDWVGKGFLS